LPSSRSRRGACSPAGTAARPGLGERLVAGSDPADREVAAALPDAVETDTQRV
jgi:hypothetical protein